MDENAKESKSSSNIEETFSDDSINSINGSFSLDNELSYFSDSSTNIQASNVCFNIVFLIIN